MGTLWEGFECVADRRTRKGRHYGLASILMLSVAAMFVRRAARQ